MTLLPRKELYTYNTPQQIHERNVSALHDRIFIIDSELKTYSERKWGLENKGWTSSVIPSAIDVHCSDTSMDIHCGLTEYKYLLGMVKYILEVGSHTRAWIKCRNSTDFCRQNYYV